jgi:hypothetical protein
MRWMRNLMVALTFAGLAASGLIVVSTPVEAATSVSITADGDLTEYCDEAAAYLAQFIATVNASHLPEWLKAQLIAWAIAEYESVCGDYPG